MSLKKLQYLTNKLHNRMSAERSQHCSENFSGKQYPAFLAPEKYSKSELIHFSVCLRGKHKIKLCAERKKGEKYFIII